ncbi:MAG: peptidoglycan DD-metalloendopeptidase family protein [Bacteroidales bacterium]|jgi:septal ring factor EnvC (AmiA/AmiB activator)
MASAKAYEAKRQLVVLVFMLFAGVATAQDVGTLQARNKRLKDEIAALEQRIQSTAGTIQGQLTQYRMGQSLLKSRQELIGGIEKELSALNSQITEKTQAVASLRNQHAELLTAYENLLVQAYKHRDKKLWIMHILSSRSASQAYRRWRYFRNYSDYMQVQEKKIRIMGDSLAGEEARLLALQKERMASRDLLAEEISRRQEDQKDLDRRIKQLQKNERQLKQELQQRIREQKKLDGEIQKALAALEKKDLERDPAAIEAARVLSADFAANKGNLPWPLQNAVVIESFGRITDAKWGFVFDNKGVTLSGPKGGDVKSVFNGTVSAVWMDNRDSYLIRILVSHGAYSTIYCHMVDVVVKEGDVVKTGQKLGSLSPLGEGNSYFQMLYNGVPVNPADWCR